MRICLLGENRKKVEAIVTGATVQCGFTNLAGKRETLFRGHPDYLKFNDKDGRWEVKVGRDIMSLRHFLLNINSNSRYRSSNKKLKELAKEFAVCSAHDDETKFLTYLNQLEYAQFELEDVTIESDVTEWIKKHVASINARFPSKYEFAFNRAFPNGKYTVDDRTWDYSFSMTFDSLTGMPKALATLKNKNGNCIDVNSKRMCNTSYIWRFVLDNPDYPFGYRRA